MWRAVRELRAWPEDGATPGHAGLAYARWAPLAVVLKEGKDKGAQARDVWLDGVTRCREPEHYALAYGRWLRSLQGPDTLCFTVRALGRVLVGHGNPSPTEVGLTLHHTWGVPVLPGSALKGLTAGYVEAVYGPDPGREESEREPFRGVTWEGSRMVRGPGAVYRRLFGAPDVDGPGEASASQGEVLFHDALWVPAGPGAGPMLARDVLTVHQRRYYESAGKEWPVDFDDPNPVPFLTVAPGGRFLVSLGVAPDARGGRALLERAARYLTSALAEWGLGGKTAAGYGRFIRENEPVEPPRRVVRVENLESPVLAEFQSWLAERKARGVGQREQFRQLESEWRERLLGLEGDARHAAAHLLKQHFNLKKGEEQQRMAELLAGLRGDPPPPEV
ncbi:type III-B CRISPR module RAMP protein Cmr6 [Pyxidicoccus sp. 3LFB2]